MGSPISTVVANLCMEVIEEQAIRNAVLPPKVWKRFVDDSFAIIKRSAVLSFHDTLNSIDPNINFTIEHEKTDKSPFLTLWFLEITVPFPLTFTANLLMLTL